MGLFNFENLPVNTLVGTSLDTFNKVTYGGSEVDKKYKGKISSGEVGLPMKIPPVQVRIRDSYTDVQTE